MGGPIDDYLAREDPRRKARLEARHLGLEDPRDVAKREARHLGYTPPRLGPGYEAIEFPPLQSPEESLALGEQHGLLGRIPQTEAQSLPVVPSFTSTMPFLGDEARQGDDTFGLLPALKRDVVQGGGQIKSVGRFLQGLGSETTEILRGLGQLDLERESKRIRLRQAGERLAESETTAERRGRRVAGGVAAVFGEAPDITLEQIEDDKLLQLATAFPPGAVTAAPVTMGLRQAAVPRMAAQLAPAKMAVQGTAREVGNLIVPNLRHVQQWADDVVTTDLAISQVPGIRDAINLINPSVLRNSAVGRLITGRQGQQASVEQLVQTALSKLDARGAFLTGTLPFRIDKDGFFENTGKQWMDVFQRPAQYRSQMTQEASDYIDDFLRIIDEGNNLRRAHGLLTLPSNTEGWFYVPRQVRDIRGVALRKPTNAKLTRFYDEATDAVEQGVQYERDPRAVLENHLKSTYREIIEKQFSEAIAPLSLAPKQLLPEGLVVEMRQAIVRRQRAQNEVNRLRVPRVTKDGKVTKQEKALRKTLSEQRDAANAGLQAARVVHKDVRDRYLKAIERARRAEVTDHKAPFFGVTGDTIGIKAWRNRFFTREDAKFLEDALGTFGRTPDKANPIYGSMEKLGNYVRFLSAVGDFAEPFIQGLPVLAENPRVWAQATELHYRAFFNPKVMSKFIDDHRRTFEEMASYGVSIGDPEFFAALRPGEGIAFGRLLERLPKGREARLLAQEGGRQSFGRFQASYNAGLGSARALLWEANKDAFRNKNELAAWIRNLTGALDSRALGVGPGQRGFESMWLAFSPRLLRSTIALVDDSVRGFINLRPGASATQQQVRSMRTMGQFLGGVHLTYVLTGLAAGKDWKEIGEGLNPLNGKRYLAHQINGEWIGVGGQIRAIIQFMGNMGKTIGTGEIDNFLVGDVRENPVLSAYMSRGAVGTNLATTAIEGTTGINADAYENIDSLPTMFRHLGKSALPFAVQGVLEGESVFPTVLAGMVGARTSPQRPSEKVDEARKTTMRQTPALVEFAERDWKDIPDDVQNLVDAQPDVVKVLEERAKHNRSMGNRYQEFKDEEVKADKAFTVNVNTAWNTMGPSREFRDALSFQNSSRSQKKAALRVRYEDDLDFFNELEPSAEPFNVALKLYRETMYAPGLEDELSGDFIFKEWERRLAALFGDTETGEGGDPLVKPHEERIKAHLEADDPDGVKALREARAFLEPYFTITEDVVGKAGLADLYDRYITLSTKEKRTFLQDHSKLKAALNVASQLKRWFREQRDPEYDRTLLRWDYVTAPAHTETKKTDIRAELGRQQLETVAR